ncbi:unnamed protein product [Angiostrongylus costaricensis]|uniref:Uncharacterized protein n=1 Tax=Angiostrongylus costaricensis TaxID=334426 RepID=A0A0R3PLE2_ANGCS|nr:unnamed protein product [Angiostrongylus costaricensis]
MRTLEVQNAERTAEHYQYSKSLNEQFDFSCVQIRPLNSSLVKLLKFLVLGFVFSLKPSKCEFIESFHDSDSVSLSY